MLNIAMLFALLEAPGKLLRYVRQSLRMARFCLRDVEKMSLHLDMRLRSRPFLLVFVLVPNMVVDSSSFSETTSEMLEWMMFLV